MREKECGREREAETSTKEDDRGRAETGSGKQERENKRPGDGAGKESGGKEDEGLAVWVWPGCLLDGEFRCCVWVCGCVGVWCVVSA